MKPEHYNVILIPQQSSKIRRFALSRRVILSLAAGLFFLVALTGSLGVKVIVDGIKLAQTESVRRDAATFQQREGMLQARIALLEQRLSRINRFAAYSHQEDGETRLFAGQGPTALTTTATFRWLTPFHDRASDDREEIFLELEQKLSQTEQQIHALFEMKHPVVLSALPTVWPARGWISSEYGDRRSWHGVGRWHEGIDIASPHGSSIQASGEGLVTYVGYKVGYGKTVIIDHGGGISTLYGHCSRIYVRQGESVTRGEVLGKVGNTGRSTGPHLHYEVRLDGVPVDPTAYIVQKG